MEVKRPISQTTGKPMNDTELRAMMMDALKGLMDEAGIKEKDLNLKGKVS
jgi:hypothetical protein